MLDLKAENTDFTIFLNSKNFFFLSSLGDSALKLPYFDIWSSVIRAIIFLAGFNFYAVAESPEWAIYLIEHVRVFQKPRG